MKKIEGTIKSFEKVKALIQRKTNSNENKTNVENNVSHTEGNNNNINEERRDTPNSWRHSLSNYDHYRSRNRSSRYNKKKTTITNIIHDAKNNTWDFKSFVL